MIVIFECDRHVNLKPFWFKSRIMFRFGWLWVAVAIATRINLKELTSGEYGWSSKTGKVLYADKEVTGGHNS